MFRKNQPTVNLKEYLNESRLSQSSFKASSNSGKESLHGQGNTNFSGNQRTINQGSSPFRKNHFMETTPSWVPVKPRDELHKRSFTANYTTNSYDEIERVVEKDISSQGGYLGNTKTQEAGKWLMKEKRNEFIGDKSITFGAEGQLKRQSQAQISLRSSTSEKAPITASVISPAISPKVEKASHNIEQISVVSNSMGVPNNSQMSWNPYFPFYHMPMTDANTTFPQGMINPYNFTKPQINPQNPESSNQMTPQYPFPFPYFMYPPQYPPTISRDSVSQQRNMDKDSQIQEINQRKEQISKEQNNEVIEERTDENSDGSSLGKRDMKKNTRKKSRKDQKGNSSVTKSNKETKKISPIKVSPRRTSRSKSPLSSKFSFAPVPSHQSSTSFQLKSLKLQLNKVISQQQDRFPRVKQIIDTLKTNFFQYQQSSAAIKCLKKVRILNKKIGGCVVNKGYDTLEKTLKQTSRLVQKIWKKEKIASEREREEERLSGKREMRASSV